MSNKYDIRISEAQRHYLLAALAQCIAQGYLGADAEGRTEIDDLHGMLSDDDCLEAANQADYKASMLNDFTS